MPCAVPRPPSRRDAIAQGNVDRRAFKGCPRHYRRTAFPLNGRRADETQWLSRWNFGGIIKSNGRELPAKVVQEWLGHSSIRMTLDIYSIMFPRGSDSAEINAAEKAPLG